jgi:flagellar hook-basal body complex protein FliE
MSIGALDAAAAYGRVFKIGDTLPPPEAGAAPSPVAVAPSGGFGSMIEAMVTETATTMRAAETASARQVAGKGDLVDVATAIGSAEVALETMVAVRDRVVAAYSEIMRMQI